MAMRRPRIKAAANLMNIKRKRTQDQEDLQAKGVKRIIEEDATNEHKGSTGDRLSIDNAEPPVITTSSSSKVAESESVVAHYKENAHMELECYEKETAKMPELAQESKAFISAPATLDMKEELAPTMCEDENELETNAILPKTEVDSKSFKFPPKVDYNRSMSQHTSVSNSDDVFQTDMEVNVIQMDLQKSANGFPMSPSKTQSRQRIRPTPVFGQRRNSFVASSSPSPHTGDDSGGATPEFVGPTHRRERHYSASLSQNSSLQSTSHHYHTPHKFTPTMSIGRVRTESGCSAFSDSYAGSGKTRKADELNHRNLKRRDFQARFTRGVPHKSSLKMFDLIYYNPTTNPMEQNLNNTCIKRESSNNLAATEDQQSADKTLKTDEKAAAMPVPQLKLNSNGELILDDKSLEIETTAEQEARKVLANSSLIFLDENTGMNGFYKRQKRSKDWLPEETVKFYRCLQTVGTDFSLMCQLFSKRSRRDLKLKFKKEERCNGALINKALLHPKNFNIEELKELLDAEEREREEAEREWKEIKIKEAKLTKKVNIKTSNAARILKDGDDIYNNEHVIKNKFSKRATNTNNSNGVDKKPKPKAKRSASLKQIIAEDARAEGLGALIKIEAEHHANMEPVNVIDAAQLENELSDLLQTDEVLHSANGSIAVDNVTILPDSEPEVEECEPEGNSHKTLENLNDGTLFVNELDTTSPTTDTMPLAVAAESPASPCLIGNLEEADIQQILTELAEGSLVLVSTLDPDNADKVVNEIYMVNKDNGELYDEPLEIPEAIVQGILSVMS